MVLINSLLSTSLAGKRVAVIGASGYIGSHVVDMLLKENCSVHAISRNLPGLIDGKWLDDMIGFIPS